MLLCKKKQQHVFLMLFLGLKDWGIIKYTNFHALGFLSSSPTQSLPATRNYIQLSGCFKACLNPGPLRTLSPMFRMPNCKPTWSTSIVAPKFVSNISFPG